AFDRLDGDRVVVDVQRAGGFARRRANPTGKLRKIVGRVQYLDGAPPVAAIYQIVPVRNDVVDRAALMTKRDAAIHAARALLAEFSIAKRNDELLIVLEALFDGSIGAVVARELHETGGLAHAVSFLPPRRRPARWTPGSASSSPAPAGNRSA